MGEEISFFRDFYAGRFNISYRNTLYVYTTFLLGTLTMPVSRTSKMDKGKSTDKQLTFAYYC